MAFTFTPYEKKEYQQSSAVTQAQNALNQHQQNKPGEYQSQWQQGMNDLLSQYQNRGPFRYDVNGDAMYQQMVNRYMQQGKQAMMDTMGQAAALTGGYGNSYAQTVGQQTYQNYLQGAGDMLPQFYQMALDRYKMEGDDLLQQYGMLADQEDTAYSRYMDQLNQYYAELDRLQGAYDSERDYDYNRFNNDQQFDYGMHMDNQDYLYRTDRDAVADDQWNQQWQYQQERDKIADEQWQREFDESIRQYNESLAWQREQAAMAASRSGGGGGGGGGRRSGSGSESDSSSNQGGLRYITSQAAAAVKSGASASDVRHYIYENVPKAIPSGSSSVADRIAYEIAKAHGVAR